MSPPPMGSTFSPCSSSPMVRATAANCSRSSGILPPGPASAGDVMLQLLDQLLLVADDRADQIADGDHTDEFAVLDHRQVANPPVGHQRQAFLGGGLWRDGNGR